MRNSVLRMKCIDYAAVSGTQTLASRPADEDYFEAKEIAEPEPKVSDAYPNPHVPRRSQPSNLQNL